MSKVTLPHEGQDLLSFRRIHSHGDFYSNTPNIDSFKLSNLRRIFNNIKRKLIVHGVYMKIGDAELKPLYMCSKKIAIAFAKI